VKRGRWALRLAAGAVLFLALGGPAPGNVGGCGTVSNADARQFCSDKEFWECRREQFAGRMSTEEFNVCVGAVMATCTGFAWPAECTVTQGQADACVTILQRTDLTRLNVAELYATYTECNICGPAVP
jgi:hypothetical protein